MLIEVNKTFDIDTLSVVCNFDLSIDKKTQTALDNQLSNAIDFYNTKSTAYYLTRDSSASYSVIDMTVNSLKYPKTHARILTAIFNIGVLTADYLLLKNNKKFIVPVPPLFMSSNTTVTYWATEGMFRHKEKNNNFRVTGGILRFKREKLHTRLVENFESEMVRFFCKIAKEDSRGKKINKR